MSLRSIARLFAAAALSAACASAANVWTTGATLSSGGFTPAADNLILGKTPTAVANGSAGAEGTGGTDRLTDGLYGSSNPERYTIGNNGSLTYEFDVLCAISGINIYSQWNDSGRDGINIVSIEALKGDESWETIPDSALAYDGNSANCFAKFANPDDGFIFAAAKAIRINFGPQDNGYTGYLEIEIIGHHAENLALRNPITGNTSMTGTNAVEIAEMPVVFGATQYQITIGEAQPDANKWNGYIAGTIPAETIDFPAPPTDGDVIFTAWFRTGETDAEPVSVNGSIAYTTATPTVTTRDITLMLNKGDTPRKLSALDVIASYGDPLGVFAMSVTPSSISALGTTKVTASVVNNAGNVTAVTADVTAIGFAASEIGMGNAATPLPHSYFKRLLHLGANFNDDWIASGATGGVDGDQLANFGGQAHQYPYDGLVYDGVLGATPTSGSLVWTEMDCPDESGRWSPTPDRGDYIKYWHIYINMPDKVERKVWFRHYNDDGIRVWNNGILQVSNGGSGGEYVSEGRLYPGLNSITIKLQEGGGGDYMQLRITDADGNYFDDLTYQFSPYSFSLVDPVTGSGDYTASSTLNVAGLPVFTGSSEYQFTTSSDPGSISDSAWIFYDSLNPPRNISFTAPESSCVVTNVLWVRERALNEEEINSFVDTITYSVETPTAIAKDIEIMLDSVEGTLVTPEMIDNGSLGGESGIYQMTVSPARVTTPGQVTLTVMNNAGLTDSAVANITSTRWSDVFVSALGDDSTGTGRPEAPFRSITRALAEVDSIGGTVYVGEGIYSAANGEVFPISLANGVSILDWDASGTSLRTDRVVDGGNEAQSLFTFADGNAVSSIRGLHLRDTTGPLVDVSAAEASLENILFTQSVENYNAAGAIQISNNGIANAAGCEFLSIRRIGTVWCSENNNATFNATNCAFNGNSNSYGAIAAPSGSRFDIRVDDTLFATNSALSQKLHDGQAAACIYIWGAWGNWSSAHLARCRFFGNTGRALFGTSSSTSCSVQDSLFVDNPVTHHIINGYTTNWLIDNCTFIRCGGGFTGYVCDTYLRNCILCDVGALTHSSSDMNDDATRLRLQNVILWNTDLGNGYNEQASYGVSTDNPWIENCDVSWDDPAFDARPRPYSPAIDAGVNSVASTKIDLAGNARIADNDGDAIETADLGCYESTFHASPVPAFQIPVPGALYVFKGSTYTTKVSVSPAASGPVTVAIEYGEGLSGPETLTIPDGAGPVDLPVTVASDCAETITRLVLSESGTSEGIAPFAIDVFPSSNLVTIGGDTRFFLRQGATRGFTVSLFEQGILATTRLPIVVNGPFETGTSSAAWNGNAYIDVDEHASSGSLTVTGGNGINTIEVTIGGGFIFKETGTDTIILTVIAHPGYLYVDPKDGSDAATGALDDPLRTATFAISNLAVGDEVRLLPGNYTTAQESFPLNAAGIDLIGCSADGDTTSAAEGCILTGDNTADTLVSVTGTEAVRIANLSFRDTRSMALHVVSATAVVTNSVFTQSVNNKAAVGGIAQRDNADVTAIDCVFTNMVRHSAIYLEKQVLNNQQVFTAKNCLFADNDSDNATVFGGMEVNIYVTLEDCTFRNNAVTQSNNQLSDAYRASALFGRNGGSLNVRRCKFLGGREGAVFGINYFNNDNKNPPTCTFDDCLFAGNYTPAGVFHGYASYPHIRNCTFVGNTGGYNGRYIFPRFYNSIICDGILSFIPPDGAMIHEPGTHLYLYDTILWNIEEGRGYETNSSANVMLMNPGLKNTSVLWSDPAFDAHLRSNSLAIDAGNNENVLSTIDLDGSPRIWKGRAGAREDIVDLGCYESETVNPGTLIFIR